MIKPVKLYLIRHAPVKQIKGCFPKHNPDAIIKKNQIKMLATLIPNNCVWYVSPLKRAIQTAEALSKFVTNSKIVIENKLKEQTKRVGVWLENLNVLEDKSIVIISHAGTIRSILSHALKIKHDYAIGIEILHQSINILEMINKNDDRHKGGRFRLLALNIKA